MNMKWHIKCSCKAQKNEEMLKSIKWSIWHNGIYYESVISRHTVNTKNTVKMVNVQEGQQHIITPQTA